MCALFTDGRFSGGSSGLVIGHASPEAAEGGTIGLVEDGDVIEIDIPRRKMHLAVSDEVLARRREAMNARERPGSRWIGSGWCRWPCRLMRRWRLRRIGGGAGSFAAQAEALRVWVWKTAPLWRRFLRFVGRPSGGRRGCSRPRLRSGAFAPDFPKQAPSSSSLPPAAAAFGFPRAHRGCSQPRPPEGLRVSMDVALLEPWSGAGFASPAETGRAGGQFLHTCLRRGGVGCGGRTLPGGECWRVLRGLLFAVHAYSSSHAAFAVTPAIHIQWRHILMRREARQHFLRQFLDGFGGGAA